MKYQVISGISEGAPDNLIKIIIAIYQAKKANIISTSRSQLVPITNIFIIYPGMYYVVQIRPLYKDTNWFVSVLFRFINNNRRNTPSGVCVLHTTWTFFSGCRKEHRRWRSVHDQPLPQSPSRSKSPASRRPSNHRLDLLVCHVALQTVCSTRSASPPHLHPSSRRTRVSRRPRGAAEQPSMQASSWRSHGNAQTVAGALL